MYILRAFTYVYCSSVARLCIIYFLSISSSIMYSAYNIWRGAQTMKCSFFIAYIPVTFPYPALTFLAVPYSCSQSKRDLKFALGADGVSSLPRCCALSIGKQLTAYWRSVAPPPSGSSSPIASSSVTVLP
jgi:hypothetical protein